MKLQVGRCSRRLHLRIHRNHGFESTASAMAPFLAWGDWQAEYTYSDYDDSLSFRASEPVDAEVIWLDYSHYFAQTPALEFAAWLRQRVLALRQLSDRPIILVNWPERPEYTYAVQKNLADPAVPGLLIGSLEAIGEGLGERLLDERLLALSGSRLSDAASILIGRELACRWIPAALAPRLKAVALDLDDTLFAGVLGEDGPEGVVLTPGHRSLQEYLLDLRRGGLFLALVSRNEESDVQQLFARRTDFPLHWEDFSARQIHWRSKADSLAMIAEVLRVGMESILYVDDNPGELASAAHANPELRLVHATRDALLTRRVLEYFPGIWSRGDAGADVLRVQDLDANARRLAIQSQAANPADYLRSLQVSLVFRLNHLAAMKRIHELSQKTNQFNLSLKRFSEPEIERRLQFPSSKVVTIRLADRLSDSGIIGVLLAKEEAGTIVVEELCISCRALGRGLEDIMVAKALETAWPQWPGKPLVFEQALGPRNDPARQWLRRLAGDAWDAGGSRIPVPLQFLDPRPEYALLDIRIERTDE
jgi:FkbH-like protein